MLALWMNCYGFCHSIVPNSVMECVLLLLLSCRHNVNGHAEANQSYIRVLTAHSKLSCFCRQCGFGHRMWQILQSLLP